MTTINPRSRCLGQERKDILRHFLFSDKIIQNSLKIDATHKYDNDLLLRQETKNKLHVLEADIITIKKHWFDISSSKDAFFTLRVPNDRHCTQ